MQNKIVAADRFLSQEAAYYLVEISPPEKLKDYVINNFFGNCTDADKFHERAIKRLQFADTKEAISWLDFLKGSQI